MQTFKQFLLDDTRKSRTQVVDVDTFIKWATKNSLRYLSGKQFLYRGGSGDAARGLRLGNAAGEGITPRESANTHNNYTLWIDNHPSFDGWPKRSLSFIGTDDRDVADGFGGAALLVLSDNAKVGYCGVNDLWETELAPIGITIEELNGMTQSIIDKRIKTYDELVDTMKQYDLDDVRAEVSDWHGGEELVETMHKRGLETLYDVWEFLVKPDIFAGQSRGADASKQHANGEVWIQGEVGFIPHGSRLSEDDKKRLMEWAEQFDNFPEEIEHHWGQDAYDY